MIVTYIFFCIRSGINQQLSSASQLSLAQLEERKTVTVQRAIVILRPAVRSREGRLFFCSFRWYCIDVVSKKPGPFDFAVVCVSACECGASGMFRMRRRVFTMLGMLVVQVQGPAMVYFI